MIEEVPNDAAERYVEVALPIPRRQLFTYRIPEECRGIVREGTRVAVPFHGRKLAGFVVREASEKPEGVMRLLSVGGVLEETPVFPAELLEFLRQAADYYLYPLGEVLRGAAPVLSKEGARALREKGFLTASEELPGKQLSKRTTLSVSKVLHAVQPIGKLGSAQKALLDLLSTRSEPVIIEELARLIPRARTVVRALVAKGLVQTESKEVWADPFFQVPAEEPVHIEPNGMQLSAIQSIVEAMNANRPTSFLLHGVTGSGKTEVYLRAIARARELGRGAIVLVPEIALTPQLVSRFRARFGDEIAVLHSALTDRERYDAWRKLRSQKYTLAIGARSALFAPVQNLGIVVVDEEHDPSFKQEEGFRYHARDMALLRTKLAHAVCVLGSATPAIETYYLSEQHRLERLELPSRATAHSLPKVEIVDLARHRTGPTGNPWLSQPLHSAIQECLAQQGQAILFLNRRGFAPSLRCEECGEILSCPACSVTLTEHRRAGCLRCHYCDFAMPLHSTCPHCHGDNLERLGIGTERIEDVLTEVYAPARVVRLDRDTASGRGIDEVLNRARRREVDIIVGTQMVTKGHDLPGVTLVGVLWSDQSLLFPDFRAGERTFQLLAQVAGRAGRGDTHGKVIFQSMRPNHAAISFAAIHDYLGFYHAELRARRELGYAPFSRLIAIRVSAGEDSVAKKIAEMLAECAQNHPAVRHGTVKILGPAPAPLHRVRARYRHRFMLRSGDRKQLRAVAQAISERIDEGISPARASVDVDPVSML